MMRLEKSLRGIGLLAVALIGLAAPASPARAQAAAANQNLVNQLAAPEAAANSEPEPDPRDWQRPHLAL